MQCAVGLRSMQACMRTVRTESVLVLSQHAPVVNQVLAAQGAARWTTTRAMIMQSVCVLL
jgi:hypothetical protein